MHAARDLSAGLLALLNQQGSETGEQAAKRAILALCPSGDTWTALREILEAAGWVVQRASTSREATEILKLGVARVVITECSLPDGDWRDLLGSFAGSPAAPAFVVTSRHADELLWAEVLNLGGYDVLAEPLEAEEVVRVSWSAWHDSRTRITHDSSA